MRDDIAVVPWATDKGFAVGVVDQKVKTRTNKYEQGDPVPANSLSFSRGDHHVWKTARGWRFALLRGGKYTQHSDFFVSVKDCLGAVLANT